MPFRVFHGLVGIGKIEDPIIRKAFLEIDDWARQVRQETEVEEDETGVKKTYKSYNLGSGINKTYDNVTTSGTSITIGTEQGRTFKLRMTLSKSGFPISITFQVEFSEDGFTWDIPPAGNYAIAVGSGYMPGGFYLPGLLTGRLMRVTTTTSGTTAVDTITCTDATVLVGD